MSVPTAAPTGTWTSGATTGDGTTFASRSARRWRSARWFLLGAGAFVLVVLVLLVVRPPGPTAPFSSENSHDDGSRAVAQVLQDQGVRVREVTRVADAVQAARPGTTLLVVPSPYLLPEQADALARADGDLVLAGAGRQLLRAATGGRVDRVGLSAETAAPREPGCDLGPAVAAGPVRLAAGLTTDAAEVTTCWHDGPEAAALAALEVAGRTVTAVDDPSFLRNDSVLAPGNAALALQLLGAHEDLVWLVQDPTDMSALPDGAGPGEVALDPGAALPRWFVAVLAWAALVALVAALWRGRRLGRLVPEDLPVVVPSAESTRGRARLYRRARSRGHAAAGLRAAAADRVARRLGLPRSADAAAVVDAVVRTTGRPTDEVGDLLYGPPPADDAALTALARRLDTLESEVHRS
ncbi:DUF4350 domain-containing protein [Isoptericola aurantiacus]|uniref:DUF4350 domain-containing protein n=1 Tax=Isoptericola aurantiacus TaxID=3377839 RepID=UPI00383A6E92